MSVERSADRVAVEARDRDGDGAAAGVDHGADAGVVRFEDGGASDGGGAAAGVDGGSAEAREAVVMDLMKARPDLSAGVSGAIGSGIALAFGEKARRKLWTRADWMHAHAVSGAYFLVGGFAWLAVSGALAAGDPASVARWRFDGPLETSILVGGAVNAVTAIPMAKFTSNKLLDIADYKSNGFTFGGAGLTLMSCWIAWWFSGSYPEFLAPFGPAFFALWSCVCVGTTLNWELMLRSRKAFEGSGEPRARDFKKFRASDAGAVDEVALLYRLASWPNLTQLLFLWSLCQPDALAWWADVQAEYPLQGALLYHYGFASALGYALSMFSETLRDRKLIGLRADLLVLLFGVFLPMVCVAFDAAVLRDAVTIFPPDYWRQFRGW